MSDELREWKKWVGEKIHEIAVEVRWLSTRTEDNGIKLRVTAIGGRKKERVFSEDELTELSDPTNQRDMEDRLRSWLGS